MDLLLHYSSLAIHYIPCNLARTVPCSQNHSADTHPSFSFRIQTYTYRHASLAINHPQIHSIDNAQHLYTPNPVSSFFSRFPPSFCHYLFLIAVHHSHPYFAFCSVWGIVGLKLNQLAIILPTFISPSSLLFP